MQTLIIPKQVHREITRIVRATPEGLETGVTLFGIALAEIPDPQADPPMHSHFVVLSIAGPGRHAVRQPAHYAVDHEHATSVYAALGCLMPGIQWLGELHLHPAGMTWLSAGDHRTIRALLAGDEDGAPPELVAGVMQRHSHAVDLYPFYFTAQHPKGRAMAVYVADSISPLIDEARLIALRSQNPEQPKKGVPDENSLSATAAAESRSDLRAESCAGRTSLEKAPRLHWLREWGRRFGRHGRARRSGPVHAD